MCDRREEGREDGGRRSGYSTKNKNPTRQCGEQNNDCYFVKLLLCKEFRSKLQAMKWNEMEPMDADFLDVR